MSDVDPSCASSAARGVPHLDLASAATRAFVLSEPRLFVGGVFEHWKGATLDVVDPSSGEVIGRIADADQGIVDRAVSAARQAFDEETWRGRLPADRERVLLRLAELIERDALLLAELDSLEMGKPLVMSRGIVQGAASFVRYMAGWATKIHGRTFTPSPRQPGLRLHGYTLREPVGVAACIVPWNVAVLMAAWKLAPALATGCSVILKPAEGTSLSALKLAELLFEVGVPKGVVSVLTGRGSAVGQALVDHCDVDKIAFTGSTAVGLRIAKAAAGRMARTTMELGGKSPFIVMPDADLELTAKAVAHAAFYNTGQICGAGTRLIAPHAIIEPLVGRVLEIAAGYRAGAALREGVTFGPLASAAQQAKVIRMVDAARLQGGEVRVSKLALPSAGFFVAPTVVVGVTPETDLFREEVFGPVLAVTGYEHIEEAVRLANDSQYGLAAGVFGVDTRLMQSIIRRLRVGTVWVNCYHIYDPTMPFGGYRQSGIGRELGEEVLDNFLETKTVAEAF
jgi:phenylacetaldehyde dehydrogenase